MFADALFRRPFLASFAALTLLHINALSGSADELTEKVGVLLAGIKHHRGLLETGRVHVRGELRDLSPKTGDLVGEIGLFIAFDFPDNKLRFDRKEPLRLYRSPSGLDGWDLGTSGGQFARSSEGVLSLEAGSNAVHLQASRERNPEWIRAFDVRALGLVFEYEFHRGTPFEEVLSNYHLFPPVAITEEPDRRIRIDWIMGEDRSMKRSTWLDTERGYWPVRLELCDRIFEAAEEQFAEPCIVSELSVTQVNNVWVPQRFYFRRDHRHEELVFDWIDVNEPVDPKLFMEEGFDLAGVQHLMDSRLGVPILARSFEVATTSPASSRDWTRALVIAVNIAILCAIAFAVWKRKAKAA